MTKLFFIIILIFQLFIIYSEDAYDYTNIDNYVENLTDSQWTIKTLSAALFKNAKNDLEKTRAVYRWIAKNIHYDFNALTTYIYTDDKTLDKNLFDPEVILKTRKAVCGGYSQLFFELCNQAGIKSEVITGTVKNLGAFFGNNAFDAAFSSDVNHAWNVVLINDKWFLIDVTIGSTWGYSVNPETKKLIVNNNVLNYFYLCPSENFINTHFPKDEKWQLLDNKVSFEDFKNGPYFLPGFFINKLDLVSPKAYEIKTKTNIKVEIIFKYPDKKEMIFGMFAKDSLLDTKGQLKKDYSVLPFINTAEDIYKFENTFTVKGNYPLLVFIYKSDGSSDLTMLFNIVVN